MQMHDEHGKEEVVRYAPGSLWGNLEQQDEHVKDIEESMVSSQMLSYQFRSEQSELRGFDQPSSSAALSYAADDSQAQSNKLHGSASASAAGKESRMSSINHSQDDITFQTPQSAQNIDEDMSMFGLSP